MPDLPELPPEIWTRIIGFLKREVPPPWDDTVQFAHEFHQHDLTVAARVSTTFHELVVPHLYTSVVVGDIPSFFAHREGGLPSLVDKITSKIDRIRLVQHLRFPGLGPESAIQWDIIAEEEKKGKSKLKNDYHTDPLLCRTKYMNYHAAGICDLFKTLPTIDLFPRIVTVVLGHCEGMGWCTYGMWQHDPRFREKVLMRKALTDFVAALRPRQVCTHAADGPYTFVDPYGLHGLHGWDVAGPPVISSHDYYGWWTYRPSNPIPGSIHREYHVLVRESDDGPVAIDENGMQELFERFCGPACDMSDDHIEKTKIEVFGATRTRIFDPSLQTSEQTEEETEELRSERKAADEEERKGIKELEGVLSRSEVFKRWKGKFVFKMAAEAPRCEACGWDEGQHMYKPSRGS